MEIFKWNKSLITWPFQPLFFLSQHYLCDPGIPLPNMEVTFSMRRLSKIEEECKQYMNEIQKMHHQLQEQRENEVLGFFLRSLLVLFVPVSF